MTKRRAAQLAMDGPQQSSGAPDVELVPVLIRDLYKIVAQLESIFPWRHFTPDGHLVGSIGESLAAYTFDLSLQKSGHEGSDAITGDGRGLTVEVKTTQGSSIGLSAKEAMRPDRLIVVKLARDGSHEFVYNGPGRVAWDLAGPPQRNGQRRVSLAALRAVEIDDSERLPVVRR